MNALSNTPCPAGRGARRRLFTEKGQPCLPLPTVGSGEQHLTPRARVLSKYKVTAHECLDFAEPYIMYASNMAASVLVFPTIYAIYEYGWKGLLQAGRNTGFYIGGITLVGFLAWQYQARRGSLKKNYQILDLFAGSYKKSLIEESEHTKKVREFKTTYAAELRKEEYIGAEKQTAENYLKACEKKLSRTEHKELEIWRSSPVKASPLKATPVKASPIKASPIKASPKIKDDEQYYLNKTPEKVSGPVTSVYRRRLVKQAKGNSLALKIFDLLTARQWFQYLSARIKIKNELEALETERLVLEKVSGNFFKKVNRLSWERQIIMGLVPSDEEYDPRQMYYQLTD